MYTQQLGHIVQQLLRQHPMVILPGLGGLVTARVPAQLDAHRGRIVPPSSTVLFNAQLNHNDGLLAQSVAAHWGFGPVEADNWITDAITEVKFALASGSSVQWIGIGTLKQNYEGRIQFTADVESTISSDAFGLKPLQLTEVHHQRDLKVRTLDTVRAIPARRIASYAAAAMMAGLMIWLPFQQGVVSNGKQFVAEMGLLPVSSEMAYSPRIFQPTWELTAEDFSSPVVEAPVAEEVVEMEDVAESVASPSQFHVVAASFAAKADADAHLNKLQQRGFGAAYAGMDTNGSHLVAYGTYATMADAEAMLASVSLSNKEARILGR